MCKGCYGWDDHIVRKSEFGQGKVDVSDFDDDFRHVKAAPKKQRSKVRGCPANDSKAHVYVWVTETRYRERWTDWGFVADKSKPYTVDSKVCCGCGKVTKTKYDWNAYYG